MNPAPLDHLEEKVSDDQETLGETLVPSSVEPDNPTDDALESANHQDQPQDEDEQEEEEEANNAESEPTKDDEHPVEE